MKKQNKLFLILFGIFVISAVAFSIVASTISGGNTKGEIFNPDGEEAVSLEAADGYVYSGNVSGEIIGTDESGEEIFKTKVGDSRVLRVDIFGDVLFVVDEKRNLSLLNPKTGEIEKTAELPGLFVNADKYGDDYYVLLSSSYSDLFVYKYSSSLELKKSGMLYAYNEDTEEMEKAVIEVAAFYVRAEKMFIIGTLGQVYVLPTDMNSLTKNEEAYLNSGAKFFTLETPVKSAFPFDKDSVIYVAGKNKNVYKINVETDEVSAPVKTMKNDVSVLCGNEKTDELFVFYDLFSDVTVLDTDKMSEKVSFTGEYNMSQAVISEKSGNLFALYRENGVYKIKKFDVSEISKNKIYGIVKTVFVVLTVICALFAAVFLGMTIRNKKTDSEIDFKKVKKELAKNKWIYIILFPSVALLFAFCYYPSVSSLIMAFFDYRSGYPVIFNGLDNFRTLFANPTIWDAVRNMVIFLVTDLIFGVIPPVAFAWCLSVMKSKRYSSLSRTLLFIPGVIPGVAGVLIWTNGIYGSYGILNTIIKACGGEAIAFLGDYRYSMLSLILMGFPFVGAYLIFYGAIANIPKAYYEAAELEGCGVIRRIISIDLPFVTPQLKYVFVMCFIGSVQNVSRVMLTTKGAAGTQIPIYIMYNYLSDNNFGVSSAMALMLFVILMIATFINLKMKTVDTDA